MALDALHHMIRHGQMTVLIGKGERHEYGDPKSPLGVTIWIRDRTIAARISLNPDLELGNAYMDGDLVIERGSLWDFFEIIGRNIARRPRQRLTGGIARRLANLVGNRNNPTRSKRNVAYHYDLSEDFYRLFLDEDMQYSCAYFGAPGMSLEDAQRAKKAHIMKKLALRDGQEVLDIGCGWGGLALSIAREADVRVTGITLSAEQLRVARERASLAGLADRVSFELVDYRSMNRQFDRIVSVGMFEHVGMNDFDRYFSQIRNLLKSSGVALVHSIGRKSVGPGSNPWIARHIFPGGYIPAASEALASVERSGLWATDVEILRIHYAETLRHWRERVEQDRANVLALYDERFYRMWCFYLASCEMAFRFDGLMVFQIQLSMDPETLPLTRAYMEGEANDGPYECIDHFASRHANG